MRIPCEAVKQDLLCEVFFSDEYDMRGQHINSVAVNKYYYAIAF